LKERVKEESLLTFHANWKEEKNVLHPTFLGGVFFVHILDIVFVLGFPGK
jgi:hypothetical protein